MKFLWSYNQEDVEGNNTNKEAIKKIKTKSFTWDDSCVEFDTDAENLTCQDS